MQRDSAQANEESIIINLTTQVQHLQNKLLQRVKTQPNKETLCRNHDRIQKRTNANAESTKMHKKGKNCKWHQRQRKQTYKTTDFRGH